MKSQTMKYLRLERQTRIKIGAVLCLCGIMWTHPSNRCRVPGCSELSRHNHSMKCFVMPTLASFFLKLLCVLLIIMCCH